MSEKQQIAELKVLLVHLNPTSARLQFLVEQRAEGFSGCFPSALPALSTLDISHTELPAVPHTAVLLKQLSEQLNVPLEAMEVIKPLLCWVETPAGLCAVALVRLTAIDPPAAGESTAYISLMELLKVPVTERLLFKKVYEELLGD